jgi:ferredoxin
MPTLSFVNADVTVDFDGSVALLDMEDYIMFGCKSGNCGTCAVRVVSGAENMSARTEKEERLFALIGKENPLTRLACQCRVLGNVVLLEVN